MKFRPAELVYRLAVAAAALTAAAPVLSAQHMLVPMDDAQQNHLKSYGVAFAALKTGTKIEWLLNYLGGSFLLL